MNLFVIYLWYTFIAIYMSMLFFVFLDTILFCYHSKYIYTILSLTFVFVSLINCWHGDNFFKIQGLLFSNAI